MIDFAQPGYLLLLAVVAAMVVGAWRLNRWRSRARQNFAGPQAGSWPASAFWARTLLVLAAALLVAFSAARPQWGKTERFREREGVDFVIALDISKSMEATDAQPSRLALAQEELVRLVEAERGSRIGLVFFAGNAFLRSPLTSDTQAMVQLIRRANQEVGLTRVGSDLGAALDVAGAILAGSEENRGRAVVLVSDGEDHAGSFAAKAAELQAKGIAVHTAGVGTLQGGRLFDRSATGAQIPHLDASGQPVVTRLDEGTLRAIAGAGGGNYRLIGPANDTLLDVRVDLRRLDPTPIADERLLIPVERYQFFIGGAIILLLASWFLPARWPGLALTRVRRVRPQPGVALLLAAFFVGACGSAGDSLRDSNREANRLFESGDFEGALAAYQELLALRPDVDELSYNAGNTLHRLENFERAIAETQRALPPNEVQLGVATYYSLGNHFLYSGRFEEAYVAYRAALLLDPTDQDSKHNLEIALLAMDGEFQPGGPDDQGQGEGTPQPGQGTPQAGDGTPQAGEGTPRAGQGTPEPGGAGTPNPTPGNTQSFERTLEEALAGIDEELTFEEAIAILDLLRQRQQMPRSGPGFGPAGPDY